MTLEPVKGPFIRYSAYMPDKHKKFNELDGIRQEKRRERI
jgi:hypothetical protein